MKQSIFLWILLWMAVGCNNNRKSGTEDRFPTVHDPRIQEKDIRDTRIRLTYVPPCKQEGAVMEPDTTEVVFKLNVFSAQLKETKDKKTIQALSYGIDSLFVLTSGQDSLPPLLAQRIANGNLRGAEYLLVFDRTALRQRQEAVLVFRDWLFTSVRMEFPINIAKIDSISCGL
ncbi:hypothetical protein [Chitinophaga defluvii]|uniref:Lipoprotein n=1 Tax=Chitinophaga defluvii TaxID=3163343 RepID=A0ABV2T202_9BACT